jgi:cobalt-precorrin-5B (C1)-methyltransferase
MSDEIKAGHSAAPPAKPEKVRKGDARRERGNRTGFTTGTCAAAAARAATLGLLAGEVPASVTSRLANGSEATFAVIDGRLAREGDEMVAHAVIVKDAGDDPDATHGAHMTADVRLLPHRAGEIVLKGGFGVGVVTKDGLGLEVGGPAINPVPQRNIRDNVRAVGNEILASDGLEVTISVPGGDEMAKKTLNARLGILGGISILGTTGIVRPYSTAAFRASVVQAVDVAARQGQTSVVFTTGGRTEKFAMRQLPELDESCFVQMGDFVKAAFNSAGKHSLPTVYVGAMVGKLTKMCQGLAVTHAWKAEVDRDILADSAREVGAPADLIEEIRAAETARFAAERLMALGLSVEFHRALAKKAIRSLKSCYPGAYQLTVLVCDFDGQFIVRVEEEEAL